MLDKHKYVALSFLKPPAAVPPSPLTTVSEEKIDTSSSSSSSSGKQKKKRKEKKTKSAAAIDNTRLPYTDEDLTKFRRAQHAQVEAVWKNVIVEYKGQFRRLHDLPNNIALRYKRTILEFGDLIGPLLLQRFCISGAVET